MIVSWEGRNLDQIKGQSLNVRGIALFSQNTRLDHIDIGSGRAFLALLDVKGNLVAFIEGFKAGGINC